MATHWLAAAACVLLASPVSALEWTHEGGLDAALQTRTGESIDTRGFLGAGVEKGVEDWTFTGDLRLEGDLRRSKSLPDGPEQVSRASWNRKIQLGDRATLDVRNLVAHYSGDAEFTLGKQPLVWGNADGVQVLDVIAPRDYRSFVLEDPVDSRISLWSIRWTQPIGDTLIADSFLIIDPTMNVYPSQEGIYAFTSSRIIPSTPGVTLPVTQLLPGVTDQSLIASLIDPLVAGLPIPDGLNPTLADPLIESQRPEDETLQAGTRLSYAGEAFDLSLYYANLHHRNPRYGVTAAYNLLQNRIEPTVTLDFVRTHLVGLSSSKAMGAFVGRMEATYMSRAPLAALDYPDDGKSAVAPEFAGVLGVDRMLPGNWFVSGQFYVKDPIEKSRNYENRSDQRALTALVRSDAFGRLPQLELFGFHSLLDQDSFVRAQVVVRWTDAVSTTVGTDQFLGGSEGVVGQYDGVDRVFARLKWLF